MSLIRQSSVMAAGTVASRLTGFMRVIAITAALGLGEVNGAYAIANTAPNIVYELLLGGVLTSVVVPLLVEAQHEDEDGGDRFASLLITLVTLALAVAVVVLVVAAPLVARVFVADDGPRRDLTVTLLRFFLPQILFYGIGAAISAVLNTRRVFGAPMVAPVLNNLVVVGTAIAFALAPGPSTPSARSLSGAQTLVLGIGTTLGVVIMTVALLPSLRRTGFRFRPSIAGHPRLGKAARLGGWVVAYVVANQLGYAVIVRLASETSPGGPAIYQSAFILFQLPHAIVTVSVITALVPRMSGHAVARDAAKLRADLSRGLRLALAVLIPGALGFLALSRPISLLVFDHGAATTAQAALVARVLVAFAIGLPFFSAFQVLLRTFYVLQDSRTPALVNVGCVAVNVAVDLLLFTVLDGDSRLVGLAVGHAASYAVGTLVLSRLLSVELGGLDGKRVVRTGVRVLIAGAIAAVGAQGAARVATGLAGEHGVGPLVAVLAGGVAGLMLFASCATRMRVREVTALTRTLRARTASGG